MKRLFLPLAMAYTIVALFFAVIMPASGTGANEIGPEVKLSTSPTSFLFDISNMKPGDSIARELTVINDGNRSYHYQSQSNQTAGSEKLFRQLQLSVFTSEKYLFEGSLADFTGFEPRFLESGTDEDITFIVEFPWESGNEFQGLATAFEIKLWAEATATPGENVVSPDGGSPPVKSGFLPQTGEEGPMMYYILGALLILFGYSLYKLQRRGARVRGEE